METNEPLNFREEMAEMHEYIIQRIQESYKSKSYIEVCWLCYTCFENRINRSLEKIVIGCTKENDPNPRGGITSKIECLKRLKKANHPLLGDLEITTLSEIKGWCSKRNKLMHNLLTVERYKALDKDFQSLAQEGAELVNKAYALGAVVRTNHNRAKEIPTMDEASINKCRRKTRCIKCS